MVIRPRRIGVLVCAWIAIAATSAWQDPHRFADEPDTANFPRVGRYVGKPACVACHRDEAFAIDRAVHAPVVGSEALMGCETCHGPGHAHATDPDNEPESITYPPALSLAGQARLCGRCHAEEMQGHGGDPAGFVEAGIGCTECHAVHERPRDHGSVAFQTRQSCDAMAEPVGGERCATCHPLKHVELEQSAHATLATSGACEACHGEGSMHDASRGVAHLITRPDRARDGIATCRACHAEVDADRFHWRGSDAPLLTEGLTCTTCHVVHAPTDRARHAQPTNRLCVTCHEPAFDVLERSVHDVLGGLDTPLSVGCGSCHAGAVEHAKRGGLPDLVESLHGSAAATQTQVCSTCHADDAALHGVATGVHARSGVACLSCHSPAPERGHAAVEAAGRCVDCHADVSAEFRLPHRHPVAFSDRPGAMGCVDCHDPHRDRRRAHDLELREGRCVECHREYRGPFVFEHQASRRDGCVVCHLPHGSSNRRLLRTTTSQQLCVGCHADFPAFHDQTQGSVFTNCVGCHSEVHGSNHSRFLFR